MTAGKGLADFASFAGRFMLGLACLHSLSDFFKLEAIEQPARIFIGVVLVALIWRAIPTGDASD